MNAHLQERTMNTHPHERTPTPHIPSLDNILKENIQTEHILR